MEDELSSADGKRNSHPTRSGARLRTFQQEQFAVLTARQQEELVRFFDKLNPA